MFKKIMLLIIITLLLYSQNLDPSLEKWINIGSLQSKFQAGGCERAYNNAYYEGMRWPAWYSYTDNHVIDRQWLVCKNFTDLQGQFYSYLGVYFSASWINPDYGYPVILEQTAKFETPVVKVDNIDRDYNDYVDTYHSNNVSYERKLVNVFNSYLGIEYTRTIYGYSQQYHDNYFITEYVLKNTGNTDYDADIELPNNSIEGLLFGMMPRYATSREVGYVVSGQMTWGKDQWVSFMDIDDVNTYNPDSLRCFWTWFGQNSDISSAWDHMGGPDGGNGSLFNSKAGRLTGPQFAGMAFLHADKSATDKSDDTSQPKTLSWHGGDSYPSVYGKSESDSKNLYDMLTWTAEYSDAESGFGKGDTIPMVGLDAMRKPYGDEKPQADFEASKKNDRGGAAALVAFGPYDLEIGESVRIVLVEAVSGLDRQKCVEVGENWYASKNLILPDGTTAVNRDEYKNEWLYTGRDSLFQTFKRARNTYRNHLVIPNPPQPPTSFIVSSGNDHILLDWTASPSELDVDFGGYHIYRALADPDSDYGEIFVCGEGTGNEIVHEFRDETAIQGLRYYYYITAFSDGSLNANPDVNPIGSLESSRSYTITTLVAMVKGLPPDGEGSIENPFLINSVEDFYWMMINTDQWDKHYEQIRDINFSTFDACVPIGRSDMCFTGTYDGNGYVIDSLYINNPNVSYLGLFGSLSGAAIKNIYLTHVNITGDNYIGGLVGNCRDSSAISNCHCSGTVTGDNYIGGLVGNCR
ncbi:MAG: hypothetical protein KAT14_00005, partial [Candidatus Marinimicrobia bacterium]|nr:hypothetical protein [Candidatus Neomarinimicrobiota bacterium]